MSDERLYGEDEIKRIIEAASTEPDTHAPTPASDRLTLQELQEIGRQVGIAPERIADAALALNSAPPVQGQFGLPITVRQTVTLPRAPTDTEWLMLVADLRETFDARGSLGTTAGIREWRNGNLHAYIEPTRDGYRLRMGTRKSGALAFAAVGLVGLGWSVAAAIGMSLTGNLGPGFLAPAIVSVAGAGVVVSSLFTVPAWARRRAEQMRYIAGRARALLGSPAER